MSHETFGYLGDPEADDPGQRANLKGLRRSVDYAEKRRDDAFQAWKDDPTIQKRLYYDVAVKSWAQTYNRYQDALSKELSE